MTETEISSQYPLALSSSPYLPPPPQYQPYIGSFVNLVSNYGLRYEGFLCYFNYHDLTLGLQNVLCYGTEGRNNTFQVPPSSDVHSCILFNMTQIKKMRVTPLPTCFTHYGYGRLAREATLGKHSPHATMTTPSLPIVFSSTNHKGTQIRQEIPLLISDVDEELTKTQPTKDSDASSVKRSANDGLQISQPQNHHQAPKHAPFSEKKFAPQSLFTTFPPAPISFRLANKGSGFEALAKNFVQYRLWGRPQENKNYEGDANTIDGSFYMISRNPFDPIGRPYNPFGPVEKPLTPCLSTYQRKEMGI